MPDYRKVQIEVTKQPNTTNVRGFRVYVREVPESRRPEDYGSFNYIGMTDATASRFVWDRAVAGRNYAFQVCAIDAQGNELQEAPLNKEFFCNPSAPTAVSNIRVELLETKVRVRWN